MWPMSVEQVHGRLGSSWRDVGVHRNRRRPRGLSSKQIRDHATVRRPALRDAPGPGNPGVPSYVQPRHRL